MAPVKLTEYRQIEHITTRGPAQLRRLALAAVFLAGVIVFTRTQFGHLDQAWLLIAAALIGGYMAMNIGANDVANNVGPAVGSRAMTLGTAIVIAAVFEAAGAIIAGGDVVSTVKNGIIDPADIGDPMVFVWVMIGALLGAAIWLNIATWLGAPVSTTHSIVGGVMGAGIASSGFAIVNWPVMGAIAASWVISPLVGGLLAAALLYVLERKVLWQVDPVQAAIRYLPYLLGLMAGAFTTYIALKGVQNVLSISSPVAFGLGLVAGVITFLLTRPGIARRSSSLQQSREGVNTLFTIPLVAAAALLSFAHGANDVANAVGPLAGVVEALTSDGVSADSEAGIPLWVLVIGAVGISLGLALYGPRLIRTVGSEITQLDRSRAFCVALSAALTVIVASQLGLPVSSTHVALGGIFGVGFLREYLDQRMAKAVEDVLHSHQGDEHIAEVERMLYTFVNADAETKRDMLSQLSDMGHEAVITAAQRRKLKKALKRQQVRREHLFRIVSAWIITVPASAVLSALFYFALRGMMV
ncbi:inorganic phosphate transporter [Serinicoccus chungangensis]|uniref:inorganic phosphate transporter n=1 Tax=Serinicoccus chungangensis TaxID=767452 RepID=UPI0011197162|nr:inorganic phosphate transporter [Serinicoccus chungangensis]